MGNMRVLALLVAVLALVDTCYAQEYQDYADGYEQDNLYQDYAMKQQTKADGGGGGNGWGMTMGLFGVSYFIGAKFHSSRLTKKMKSKHLKDQRLSTHNTTTIFTSLKNRK